MISGEVGGAKLVERNLQPIKERHQLIPGSDRELDGTENTFSMCTRAKLRRACDDEFEADLFVTGAGNNNYT